jgi:hypothetical protein
MEFIKDNIVQTFKTVMFDSESSVDPKMMQYWANAISKNDKTLDDFKTFLYKSQDYAAHLRNTFMDVFSNRLCEEDYQACFAQFQNCFESKEVRLSDIVDFVTTSKLFVEKFTHLIQQVYCYITSIDASDEVVQFYLKRFQQSASYTVDELKHDIQANAHDLTKCDRNQGDDRNALVLPADISENDAETLHALWTNAEKFIEYFRASSKDQNDPMNRYDSNNGVLYIVDEFEKVYKRNMNIREYLLYVDQLRNVAVPKLAGYITELHNMHVASFTEVGDIVFRYLHTKLDEDAFIKLHLSNISDPGFLDTLRNAIIASHEYEEKMTDRVSALYKSMYDETLDAADLSYVFGKIRAKGHDLMDESVNNLIVAFKNETDDITQHIFGLFVETYEREPDVHEIAKYLSVYRLHNDKAMSDVDAMIEKELTEALEYHDVIKAKIKKIHTMHRNTSVLPSHLYAVLQKVLLQSHHESSTVDELITKLIQEL